MNFLAKPLVKPPDTFFFLWRGSVAPSLGLIYVVMIAAVPITATTTPGQQHKDVSLVLGCYELEALLSVPRVFLRQPFQAALSAGSFIWSR